MDKLHLPTLSESDAARILQNVSNAVCQPIPKAQAIMEEINYISYKFQRLHMTASQVERLGLPNCADHEQRYLEEAEKASEGES